MSAQYSICLIHNFDPRGIKAGGLETYSRDFMSLHPADTRVVMIGVDEIGDLKLGELTPIEVNGRKIEFLPVAYYPEGDINRAATNLGASVTLQLGLGLLRYWGRIRRILRQGNFTIDNRRVELGPICWSFGVPYIQMMHTEGAPPNLPMDSLIKKYRFVYNSIEVLTMRTCARFLCVNPYITERMRKRFPSQADKIDTLTTWFNPRLYKPTPYLLEDDVFRIVFCGRLDVFKDPPLMFRTLRLLWEKRGKRGVEFHYVGATDPERYPEFAAIREFTVLHGFRKAPEMAQIMTRVQASILTSHWEGMPRCVMEALGSGRPTGAIHLPQLELVIKPGVSGYLVARTNDVEAMANELSDRFLDIWQGVNNGQITPQGVADMVAPFTPEQLLGRVFNYHKEIQNDRLAAA